MQTHPRRPSAARLASVVAFGSIALPVAAAVAGPTGVLLTADNRLHTFDTAAPTAITGSVAVSGLTADERLLGIDFRPAQPTQLFGLGSFGQLYQINPQTGSATRVGTELTPEQLPLTGDRYGFDFNPVVDRLRVVSDAGENYRLNPNDGAVAATDGPLQYAAADANAGEPPAVGAAAYTNSDNDPATGTALYDIDSELGVLAVQNPPNAGTLQTIGSLNLSDFPLFTGFDIFGGENAAYAVTTAEPEAFGLPALDARLFTINLQTGAASPVGLLGDGSLRVEGFAVTDAQVTAIPLPAAALVAPLGMAVAGVFYRRMRPGAR